MFSAVSRFCCPMLFFMCPPVTTRCCGHKLDEYRDGMHLRVGIHIHIDACFAFTLHIPYSHSRMRSSGTCVYIHVCTFMHALRSYSHVHSCMRYVHIRTLIYVHLRSHMNVCRCVPMPTDVDIGVYMCIDACIAIYTCKINA